MTTETFFSSFILVALSEIGDKTQLLALSLAARYRRPWPILGGIFCATVANHAAAAFFGSWLSGWFAGRTFDIAVGVSFIVFGLWTLKPDRLDEQKQASHGGIFWTTTVLFFLAEMGDKTQLATLALGARFASTAAVTAGTTLGMLAADGPAVFLGGAMAGKLPMKPIRIAAAALFFMFGVVCLLGLK